ncbi:MAG: HAD family hydrolase [Gemmatimonadota bacterium]|nr:MAG: HAD family hydrolase [Gemmatimonadota bacterium]
MRRAVFLDRDGTVSEEVGYVNHVSRFRLLPRSAVAIRRINESDFVAVLVTNQAGVARGYFKESLVKEVHGRLEELLAEAGAHLDAIYYCPHHPSAGEPPYRRDCECRKPKPGMVEAACRDLDIDLSRSFMVGDKHSDIVFAHSVGMKGVLVKTGYGLGEIEGWAAEWNEHPDGIADDLFDAVEWILSTGE